MKVQGGDKAMRLVEAVQQLSLARDLETVQAIVRRAARELASSDGATFVLRDVDLCYYADEDAIEPLWKGHRFPMTACVSGWAMLHREHVVIEDIYADPRVPVDAYRPTFVKSLTMVPIRTAAPIGAIGNYWAVQHRPSPQEILLLQALADSTSIAMENIQLYAELERRVKDRTAQLEAANAELEAFSGSVSHDLRAPLRSILGFTRAFIEDHGAGLGEEALSPLSRVSAAATRMGNLVDDLLRLSQVTRGEMQRHDVNVTRLVQGVVDELVQRQPARVVDVAIAEGMRAQADEGLVRVVLVNLLGNAWKFTGKTAAPRVEVGMVAGAAEPTFFVRDNGAGFDPAKAKNLFAPFQRMHAASEYEGTGIGLATVHRVVRRHGGKVWAEAAVGRGATFFFTLA